MSRQHIIQTKKAFAQRAGRHIAPPKTKTVAIARSSLHPLEEMQALYGNRAVNQLLASQPSLQAKPMFGGLSGELQNSPMQGKGGRSPTVLQAKLEIGAVGDKYEQEADRVAALVVSQINAPQSKTLQRENISKKEEEEEHYAKPEITAHRQHDEKQEVLQGKSSHPTEEMLAGGEASTELETAIKRARVGGQPLNTDLQEAMEQVMQTDLSRVRVHTDSRAAQLNQSIQAKAFTTGQDVFFGQGAYQPGSRGGQELIAHELTHVMQQTEERGKRSKRMYMHEGKHGRVVGRREEKIQRQGLRANLKKIQQEARTQGKANVHLVNLVSYIMYILDLYTSRRYEAAYKSLVFNEGNLWRTTGVEVKVGHAFKRFQDMTEDEFIEQIALTAAFKGHIEYQYPFPEGDLLSRCMMTGDCMPIPPDNLLIRLLPIYIEEWLHALQNNSNQLLSTSARMWYQTNGMNSRDLERYHEADIYGIFRELGSDPEMLSRLVGRYESRRMLKEFIEKRERFQRQYTAIGEKRKFRSLLALAMGLDPRVGADSPVRLLAPPFPTQNIMSHIASFL